MCPLSQRADSPDRLDKSHVAWTSVRFVPRLSGCGGHFARGRFATASMRAPAAACNEAQLDDCIIENLIGLHRLICRAVPRT